MASDALLSVSFDWIPKAMAELNKFYDKAPFVAGTCMLLICSTPFVLAVSTILKRQSKSQDSDLLEELKKARAAASSEGTRS